MKHYVVYHNVEKMGYALDEADNTDEQDSARFTILTNKSVRNLVQWESRGYTHIEG